MTKRRPASGTRSNAARDDVADFGPAATTKQQRDLGAWAQQTRQQLEDPTPAQRRAREAELREDFTERAAIFEYLGGIARPEAERRARALVYGRDRRNG